MRFMQDTATLRKNKYAESNTNTTTLTLAAIVGERHVIDQIIWSTDSVPVANTSHITITDTTANSVLLRFDLGNQYGANQFTFEGGFAAPVNAALTIVLVTNTAGQTNHLTALYR